MSKIAFLNIDYSMGGGVERVTSDLINMFLKQGETVMDMFTVSQRNQETAVEFSKSLLVHVIGPLKSESEKQNFVEKLVDRKIDVLIYQADNMSIALSVLECARKAGVKAIGHYHGSPYAYLQKYPDAQHGNLAKILFSKIVFPFKKNKLKKFLTLSEAVVCVSQRVRKELKDLFPNHDFPIYSILNPLRFEDEEYPGTVKKNIITLVSRLEKAHKNAFLAATAWSKIAHQHKDWTLRFLGTGSLENEMKSYFSSLEIENVEFLGFKREVGRLLAESSIGISTSNCEGFSMAVLEYILTGNAVVTTDSHGGVHDMIEDGRTGIVVQRNSAEALSAGIARLINDSEERDFFAKNALSEVKTMYGADLFLQWKKLVD
ncbi:hypothetical protein M472_17920 [Sphingobacterium paucimobilis HER1398]|uniref:Glycosyl transferase family 1 domain-containing protein n=2 Tax=Sphingobacterium TaxID=28453 RepID=U2HYL7_9SPHI|nr:hypothetical protein M472_17920 [Sphingobacterium paucimobilis HER1398]